MRNILLIVILFILALSCGCKPIKYDDVYQSSLCDYKVEGKYIDFENTDFIANYPHFSSQEADFSKSNEMIAQLLEAYIVESSADIQETSAKINFTVHSVNSKYISISYDGFFNYKEAAHPIRFYFTTNLNSKNGKTIKLSDILVIDDNLIKEFREEWKTTTLIEVQDYLEDYTNEQLTTMLLSSDTNDGYGVFSCFSENKIMVFFPVSHALGDYVIIELQGNQIN